MLDRVLGAGNSILRVSTDHDFERISRNSQLIDPESRIVISEEQRTETNNNIKREPVPYDENDPPDLRGQSIDLGGGNSESQVKIRNYEVNTTQQSYEKPVGVVTRMSVSVLLDYKRNVMAGAEGQDSVVYTPYANAEIRDIENVVRSALGIQIGRGDEVSITQIRFQDDFANEFMNQQVYYQEQIQMNEWLRWGLILLGLMAALGLLYGIVRRVNPNAPPLFFDMKKEIDQSQQQQKALPGQGSEDETISEEEAELDYLDDDLDVYQRKLSPEAQRRLKMKSKMYDEVKNFAEFKSEDAANMVRSLLMQNKNSEDN
jgi:flagellar M-ring protein FliF